MSESIEFHGLTYSFDLITIEGEEEWAKWVRKQAMSEATEFSEDMPLNVRASFLAKVSSDASLANCGFAAEFGLQNFKTSAGMAKILQLAGRKNHPGLPFELMLQLAKAKEIEAARVALNVIPISQESREMMLGQLEDIEKKVTGLKAGRAGQPSKSAGT